MIRVGVTPCFLYPDLNRTVFGAKTLCYLEKDMGRYLSRPGVMPLLIPDLEETALDEWMDQVHGVVLQGGSDLAPATYGEAPLNEDRWPGDPHRDQYELLILKKAMERDLPVFGICRGFQVMNAYFGGTLLQDIQTLRPSDIAHRDAEQYDQIAHPVRIKENTWFSRLHAQDAGTHVNTIHHQAVDKLGHDLEALAWSPDGLIEAFSWSGAPDGKVMGVQWHPEFFYNHTGPLLDPEVLYTHFLRFCTP